MDARDLPVLRCQAIACDPRTFSTGICTNPAAHAVLLPGARIELRCYVHASAIAQLLRSLGTPVECVPLVDIPKNDVRWTPRRDRARF